MFAYVKGGAKCPCGGGTGDGRSRKKNIQNRIEEQRDVEVLLPVLQLLRSRSGAGLDDMLAFKRNIPSARKLKGGTKVEETFGMSKLYKQFVLFVLGLCVPIKGLRCNNTAWAKQLAE